jgi:hypothetical protein
LAEHAASLRWSQLFDELVQERRREFLADCIDEEFGIASVVWFGNL